MPDHSMQEQSGRDVVAFIGLGNMGTPMAGRLLDAGHRVVGFDLSDDAMERFTASGGTAAATAHAAASQADVVILMLPNSNIVESVVTAGVADSIRPGSILVDMSSSEPIRTRALAAKLRIDHDVELVDAPVSGGVKGAVNGTLVIMVGGSDAAVHHLTPTLEVMGKPTHVGDIGSGHALKALNNLLSATHLMITSEAITVGKRFGLDPEVMLSVINGSSGRSGSTENKWPNFILPETYDSGFALRLMLKDMRIATDLAEQLKVPSMLGNEAVQFWTEAAKDLPTDSDHTEIARWLDRQNPQ